MERAWVFETLAITVALVDFLDPAMGDRAHARERGVRLEVRPVGSVAAGSVYVSPTVTMQPAVCRIDLLESEAGAADRMHWHPVMASGEPAERVFDPAMPHDPPAWLAQRLHRLDELLEEAGVFDVERHRADVAAIPRHAEEIVAVAGDELTRAREPWPVVFRDARGMAIA